MPTPAQWQSDLVLDQILTTTLQNWMRTLYEQVLTHNYLYYWLYSRDRIKTMDGGEAIVVPLMYGLNETVKFYSDYDELDVTPQDGLTPARYEWKQMAGSISISRKEERQNSGKARMLSLLEAKAEQLKYSLYEKLGEIAYGDGSADDGKAFLGLDALVEDIAAASMGTVGGIDSGTYDWWRNQQLDFDTTYTTDSAFADKADAAEGDVITGETAMRSLYLSCCRGPFQPDLGITHVDTWGQYEAALSQNQRFTDTETASHGFMNLKFKNATMGWDASYINSGAVGLLYFLTSEFMKIIVDTETNFKNTDFIRPHNQDARSSQVLLMGNMVVTNRQRHGVLWNFS